MINKITISCITEYLETQSEPKKDRYVFSYTIAIQNLSQKQVQLLSRHWIIQDANNKTEEIKGDGVIGEQPIILPDQEYSYTSGAILETEIATMQGSYRMVDENQTFFDVQIPKFILSVPRVLH